MEKVNLEEKFSQFTEHWEPKIVSELNGQQVKLAKLMGEFVWHSHEHEDEMFMVVKGQLIIELRDKTIILNPNEFLTVPKGVEHKPIAHEEVWIMLFEPASTVNTGDAGGERTKEKLDRV
jgi:mannose-6-phosphate isomerase-like protein (cupin superfamily)